MTDDGVILKNVTELNKFLEEYIFNLKDGEWQTMLDVAAALGGVFAVIVAARVAFRSVAGGGGLDVLALMRPVAIAFLLANWYPFSYTLYHITQPIEDHLHALYQAESANVTNLRVRRKKAAYKVDCILMGLAADVKTADVIKANTEAEDTAENNEENKTGELGTVLAERFDDVWYPDTMATEAQGHLVQDTYNFFTVENIITWLTEVVWEVMAMAIFLIRNIYLAVLVIFGPLWMAASVLPAWKDAWAKWIGSVITVSLWGGVAYLVMTFSLYIMDFGVSSDVTMLEKAAEGQDVFWSAITYDHSNLGTLLLTAISSLAGVLALTTVPELASMCWPSDVAVRGATTFLQGAAGVAMTTYQATKKPKEKQKHNP